MRNLFYLFILFVPTACLGYIGRAKQPCSSIVFVDSTKYNIGYNSKNDNTILLQKTIYTKKDSIEIEKLLKNQIRGNDVLYYARYFIGRPYKANTLDIADHEKLVVNLQELDCTTFVETVCALAMTKRQGRDKFADYCRNLIKLRYKNGQMNGYISRLHYFTWWMHDNIHLKIFKEIKDAKHFTSTMIVQNYYMSKNIYKYKILSNNPQWVDSIKFYEKKFNGKDGVFLPQKYTNFSKRQLNCINDGDIIAIVTTKKGLDYSHLGFAVWEKDNRLHLLNASMIYKKVVEDKMSLFNYLAKHKTFIGLRLLRLV